MTPELPAFLQTVRKVAEVGADVISVGVITHSAPDIESGLNASD